MDTSADLDAFLADMSVSVVVGSVTGKGILDSPSTVVSDGLVLSTDYTLTIRSDVFGTLINGNSIQVDGVNYIVRDVQAIDDGSFQLVGMSKV